MMPPNSPPYPISNTSSPQNMQQQQQQQQMQQQQMQQQNQISQFSIDSNDTSFQPVDAGFVGSGAMDNSYSQKSQNQSDGNDDGGSGGGCFQTLRSVLQVSYLKKNFDVDTADIQERLVGSVMTAHVPDHFLGNILWKDGKRSDLYGPFWISMTLVMFLSVTANTSKFLKTNETINDVEFDINHLFHSFNIVFLYAFLLPTFLYGIIHCVVQDSSQPRAFSLIDLIALYGYSFLPYIPATLLCLVPIPIVEWFVLAVATFLSVLLILRNIAGPLMRQVRADGENSFGREKLVGSFLMVVVACHIVLFFVMKFVFFRHGSGITADSSGGADGSSSSSGSNVVDITDDGAGNVVGYDDGDFDGFDGEVLDDDGVENGGNIRW